MSAATRKLYQGQPAATCIDHGTCAIHDEAFARVYDMFGRVQDILSELRESVAALGRSIDAVKDQLSVGGQKMHGHQGDIELIKSKQLDRSRILDDMERRIRSLEKFKWVMVGAIVLSQFAVSLVFNVFKFVK